MRVLTTGATVAFGVLLAAGCSSGHRATTDSTPPAQRAALALAHRMVSAAMLPPGARALGAASENASPGGEFTPAIANLESAHRGWKVNQAPHDVYQWLQVHVPRGFTKSGGMESGADGGAHTWAVDDDLKVRPMNVSYASLSIAITGNKSGPAYVRVDGVVGWTSPRPANEFVSARDHVVTVTVVHAGGTLGKRVVVTEPAQVTQLVRAFNRLRIAPRFTAPLHCPMQSARSVQYRVAFARTAGATPDVVVTLGHCGPMRVSVNGRTAPSLDEFDALHTVFSNTVAHVLGLSEPHFG